MDQAAAPPSTLLVPNLVIAGVTKAGTTSLFAYLAQHPEVCPAKDKGANYFSVLRYGDRPLPPLSDYARQVEHCAGERYRMEASLSYWYGGTPVIAAIAETIPDARILISLRDPVQRLWSGYKMKRGKLPVEGSFSAFVARSEHLRAQGLDTLEEYAPYRTLSTGRYADYLEPWLEAFGERLRVVFFEDLVSQPVQVIEGIFGWLGLDPDLAASFDYTTRNKSVQHRSLVVRRLAETLNAVGWRAFRSQPRLQSALRSLYLRVNSSEFRETLQPEVKARLAEFYRPSNVALAALLIQRGYRGLPPWLQEAAPLSSDA